MRSGTIGSSLVPLALSSAVFAIVAATAQTVPMDAQPTCAIAPATFAAMFESGAVTLNGVVKPADSTVNLTPNCSFFNWSDQMFLWLTSPAPRRYGGGSRIMFSPSFYTASPPFGIAPNERRDFIQNRPGTPIRMMLRATELGPHLLPAVISRTGQVIEVQRADPAKPVPPIVRLQSGAVVRLADVRRAPTGALQFFDARGAQLQVRKLALPPLLRQSVRLENNRVVPVVTLRAMQTAIQARKFVVRGIPIFVDSANVVIDVEPGQADGGVLISQNGSLIYYIVALNDVFAYSRTMRGSALIPKTTTLTMPLTTTDAATITAFAATHGHSIADPNALAIETKSSWVAASAVANPDDYIQADATVPVFDKSNPNEWVPTGAQTTIKVVMVGIHVVGSTKGHGEMVWGTYEHVGNAPSASFTYSSTSGIKTVPQNTVGSWLFTPSGASAPFNAMNASVGAGGHIVGTPVAWTPVLRMSPWGMAGSNTSMNTQVISSTASVIAQLAPGDVRRNYFQLGTTWTINGAPPNGRNQVGTNQLANATIETFMQAATPGASGSNCFTCHQNNTVAVSHVYRMMNPLF